MGETTKIGWTDHTFNPWIGCTKISEGCKHCYAETMAKRAPSLVYGPQKGQGGPRAHLPVWGERAPRRVTSAENWRQPLRWDRAAAKAGVRRRVFCASLADVFEDVAGSLVNDPNTMAEWRVRLWGLIDECSSLDWLLLTKRPENIARMVPSLWLPGIATGSGGRWPAHVWIGTTVEDQEHAAKRLPHLLRIPAPVRFVSYEPALGPVDFTRIAGEGENRPPPFINALTGTGLRLPRYGADGTWAHIDWIIVGGESGPGARPFDLAWARSVVAQGKAAGVPVFVKQMGARPELDLPTDYDRHYTTINAIYQDRWPRLRDRAGADPAEWPEDLRVQQFPEARP